jgi:hypothetical protein
MRTPLIATVLLCLASLSRAAEPARSLVPANLCAELAEVPQAAKDKMAESDPELGKGPVKLLPERVALALVAWGRQQGISGLELFTDPGFRGECIYVLSKDVLMAVDKSYDLDLVTYISGKDTEGRPFQMQVLAAGRGRIVGFYDRDVFEYKNDRHDREFKVRGVFSFKAAAYGVLDEVEGLSTSAFLVGELKLKKFEKTGPGKMKVHVGGFVKDFPLRSIERRPGAVGAEAVAEEPAAPAEPAESEALERLEGSESAR